MKYEKIDICIIYNIIIKTKIISKKLNNMDNVLYSTKKCIILCGNSNEGKTTTLNTMISGITKRNVNFIAHNSVNTTTIITIVHFTEKTDAMMTITHNNDITQHFPMMTIDELLNTYNTEVIKHRNINFVDVCNIYIPINILESDIADLTNLCFVDTYGLAYDNISTYQNQMYTITNIYPFHVFLNVCRDINLSYFLSHDMHKYKYVITHADLLDYEKDATLCTKHSSLIPNLNKNVFFVSNIENPPDKLKLDNKIISIYTNKNISNLVHIVLKYINNNVLDIKEIIKDETIFNDNYDLDIGIMNLRKYNNKKLTHIYIRMYKESEIMSLSQIDLLIETNSKLIHEHGQKCGIGKIRQTDFARQLLHRTFSLESSDIQDATNKFEIEKCVKNKMHVQYKQFSTEYINFVKKVCAANNKRNREEE